MHTPSHSLFIPGYGASARLYLPGLPEGWTALQPPSPRRTAGLLDAYRRWIVGQIDARRGPIELAGHSMGGALAILAAAARPERVERLVLVSPAGLPLRKPMRTSLLEFGVQVAAGHYPRSEAARSTRALLRAPADARRLAKAVHQADITAEMNAVRSAGIPTTVIACLSDTLVTVRHCRVAADQLGAEYRELSLPGGHMWMLRAWERFGAVLLDSPRSTLTV